MSMTTFAVVAVAPLALGVFAWLVQLERRGRPDVAVVILLALVVLDSALYANPNRVPAGILHPTFGGQPFRLPDIFVPVAVAAVVVARRPVGRLRAHSFWWAAFLAWLATQAFFGLYEGNDGELVAFEAKAIIYLGAMALAARVPVRRYVDGFLFRGLLYATAVLAATLSVLAPTGHRYAFHLPGLTVESFGGLGGDPASVFGALGVVALTFAACRPSPRLGLVVAASALMLPAIVAGQRAAVLAAAVSVAALLLLAPLGWRHLRLTPADAYKIVAVVAVTFVIPASVVASLGTAAPISDSETPLGFVTGSVESAFKRQGARSSAEARIRQWEETSELVAARPLLGWGLGNEYLYWDHGLFTFVRTDLSHDVPLDLLRRTGAVGLFFFLMALATSLWRGVCTWRLSPDGPAAAVAVACVAVVVGLMTKSLFESVLEKYRLALLLGLTLGAIHSTLHTRGAREVIPRLELRNGSQPAVEGVR